MAELATIARPYAEALFKAQSADLGNTLTWLDELASVSENAQMHQFADSPLTDPAQVVGIMTSVVRSALPENAKNFLRLVVDNGRLAALPEIARQFRALVNSASGSSDAVVYSAFPLDAPALADVTATLEKRFGRKLGVKVELDSSLIGGIRAVVGDEVLDTSVKARLEQMKVALIA
jgi:F-type H+-transporting ATPase subunit delta